MHTTITTTITTRIDLTTFEPNHEVDIEAEDVLPRNVILAAVAGGCKSTLASLDNAEMVEEVEDASDDD